VLFAMASSFAIAALSLALRIWHYVGTQDERNLPNGRKIILDCHAFPPKGQLNDNPILILSASGLSL
jgi:hypothetical protein